MKLIRLLTSALTAILWIAITLVLAVGFILFVVPGIVVLRLMDRYVFMKSLTI